MHSYTEDHNNIMYGLIVSTFMCSSIRGM